MDFSLAEEQTMFQRQMREFANKELAPVAGKLDMSEEFAMYNFKKMAGLGLTGLLIPPEYGGSGGDTIMLVIAMEEIARVCASTADILDAHLCLCTRPIYNHGNEKQRQRFLPALCKGERIGSYAITEPEAGSDIASIKCTAKKEGDKYIVNGTKIFITNGPVTDTVLLFVTINPSLGSRGITAFVAEWGMPGFSKGKKFNKMGMRAATNCELIFEDCPIPEANRVGEEGRGMRVALSILDEGRIGIAAQCVGIAQGALDAAINYAKQRVQFGVPIAQHQGLNWMLADMALRVEAARALTYRAAYWFSVRRATTECAMAKLFASETAMWVTTKAIQIHGGYGYMMDHPMQRYFRDAKVTEIYEGTSEMMRLIIARDITA